MSLGIRFCDNMLSRLLCYSEKNQELVEEVIHPPPQTFLCHLLIQSLHSLDYLDSLLRHTLLFLFRLELLQPPFSFSHHLTSFGIGPCFRLKGLSRFLQVSFLMVGLGDFLEFGCFFSVQCLRCAALCRV